MAAAVEVDAAAVAAAVVVAAETGIHGAEAHSALLVVACKIELEVVVQPGAEEVDTRVAGVDVGFADMRLPD